MRMFTSSGLNSRSFQCLIRPTATSSKHPEWHTMKVNPKHCPDDLKIKVVVRMDKPQNLKYCG